jgi:ubiquinol-cytochrome c reductase cytochrome c1 subunit
VLLPWLSRTEKANPAPDSIAADYAAKKAGSCCAVALAVILLASPAQASEGTAIPQQAWPHKSITGVYDKAALQRGFQVYKEVCAACHSMKYLSYRNLEDLGFSAAEVAAIASEYTITDGPNDDGEMFERAAKPFDRFKSPFPNDKAARAANNGALPPDFSLIVKARKGGEDYVYALLTGYGPAPADEELMAGMSWNRYFPGHQIAMAQPLMEGQVTFADGTPSSLEQEARDVAQFLAWASEPYLDERKQMGVKVFLFLVVLGLIKCAAKRQRWSGVD